MFLKPKKDGLHGYQIGWNGIEASRYSSSKGAYISRTIQPRSKRIPIGVIITSKITAKCKTMLQSMRACFRLKQPEAQACIIASHKS
jgi:hypothetical protein